MTKSALFEIGLEEMPARFLDEAKRQIEEKTKNWLKELRIPYQAIESYVTPRRLAILLKDVEDKQPSLEEEVKGPAKKIAQDEEGNWSKAALGFTRGQGRSVEDIYFKEIKGTEYIYVNKFIEGQKTMELLPSFKEVVLGLTLPKTMRWGDLDIRYVRPIRWLVALYGTEIIPFEIGGVASGNKTFGHRFLGTSVTLKNPEEYKEMLGQQFVIVDSKEREQTILSGIQQLEQENDWQIPVDEDLLNEVKHLVEYPTVFFGSFSNEFLSIPDEALVTSMKEHQRYFPVRAKNGALLANFVGVRNGDENHLEVVARGNEKVLKARLSDARFFYEEDQKHSIDENLEKLKRMVFQENLGTIADKINRVVKLTKELSTLLKVDEKTRRNAVRAAEISKFDLVTNMVNEFTDLQGVMGEKYARLFGEDKNTAKAINEHYMPRHALDDLPQTLEGSIVSIADKIDTIVGCISVGIKPTGSQDPYGLRRQALGILQIVNDRKWRVNIEEILGVGLELFSDLTFITKDRHELEKEINEFFKLRASFILRENAIAPDVVKAVLYNGIGNFSFAVEKALLLTEKRKEEAFKDTQEALVRVLNLAEKGEDLGVDEAYFESEFETVLFTQYHTVKQTYSEALNSYQAVTALNSLSRLTQPIHDFFDHTMVMVEDEQIKNNRLSLLNKIASMVFQFANLKEIEWKQQF